MCIGTVEFTTDDIGRKERESVGWGVGAVMGCGALVGCLWDACGALVGCLYLHLGFEEQSMARLSPLVQKS